MQSSAPSCPRTQWAVRAPSSDGTGAGHTPESHVTVIHLLENLIRDGAAWQAAFPSHKCYSSTSLWRGGQSPVHNPACGTGILSVIHVIISIFSGFPKFLWGCVHTVNFNSAGINWRQKKEKIWRIFGDYEGNKEFPILTFPLLTHTHHRRAQRGRNPPWKHDPQMHSSHRSFIPQPTCMTHKYSPHYAISWNVLPLQTSLGLFPHLAEVSMHSPSKTHKQATHIDRGSLQDRGCGRWLACLPACIPRKQWESCQRVWRRWGAKDREGLCGRGWWRRSSHSCQSDWISDSGLWLTATGQESSAGI